MALPVDERSAAGVAPAWPWAWARALRRVPGGAGVSCAAAPPAPW